VWASCFSYKKQYSNTLDQNLNTVYRHGDLTCERILICWKRYKKRATRLMIKDRNLSYNERLKRLNITTISAVSTNSAMQRNAMQCLRKLVSNNMQRNPPNPPYAMQRKSWSYVLIFTQPTQRLTNHITDYFVT